MTNGFFPIDLMIVKLHFAASGYQDGGTFRDLDPFLIGATHFCGHQFLVGVDQVVDAFHVEHSFIGQ